MSGFRNRSNVNVEAVVDDKGNQVGIEYAHDAVHRDILVTASDYVADVDIAAPLKYLIKGFTGSQIHPLIVVGASGPCVIKIFQGVTATGGDDVKYLRHYLPSAKTTEKTVFRNPTITVPGTEKYVTRLPGTTGGQPSARIGGTARQGEELVASDATPIIIEITPEANDTKVWIEVEYYEIAV